MHNMTMPARKLPPLGSLRGFEAAARHASFTRAADELGLTQGAISRQVRELEVHLGVRLFRRSIRRIELTEAGSAFAVIVATSLEMIERAAADLRSGERGRAKVIVSVSALPSIASFWLMPRLHLFTRDHPGIEVRVRTSIEPADLRSGEVDVALRVGPLPGRRYPPDAPRIDLRMVSDWSDVVAEELFPDILLPVGRSDLLYRGGGLVTAPDLARLPLIHTSTRPHAWPDWLAASGVRLTGGRNLEFGHFFMSLDAAQRGDGVAIVPDIVFAHFEHRGELVAMPSALRSAGGYHLLTHRSRLERPSVKAFNTWLVTMAEAWIVGRGMRLGSLP